MAELIRGISNIQAQHRGCVVTIGNFDGIHRGHQRLLDQLKKQAKAFNLPATVITFEPQPLEFFLQEKAVPRLTKWREKFLLLSQFAIDRILIVRFNQAFSNWSAEQFCKDLLNKKLDAKYVIVGDDFHFGAKRKGNIDFLIKMGKQLGFVVEIMPRVLMEDERISSTRVRAALLQGDQALAERLLGRPYTMMGRVVYGNQLGRVLGFPTANIHLHRAVAPVNGVYAVRLYGIREKGLEGVANVGIRPTIGGTRALLEVHLFDFHETIYGKIVTVEFCQKLRDEERYETLDLLKEQIGKDAIAARSYFYD